MVVAKLQVGRLVPGCWELALVAWTVAEKALERALVKVAWKGAVTGLLLPASGAAMAVRMAVATVVVKEVMMEARRVHQGLGSVKVHVPEPASAAFLQTVCLVLVWVVVTVAGKAQTTAALVAR